MVTLPEKREQWIVKNLTSRRFTLGDLPKVPEIAPKSTVDLLKYHGKQEIEQSLSLNTLINNGWVSINKKRDNVLDRVVSGDAANKAISLAEESDISASNGICFDIPVARALVPAVDGADLANITLGTSGYIIDALDFSGGADESAFFNLSADININRFIVDVLVTSTANDSSVARLTVGAAKTGPSVDLDNPELDSESKLVTLSTTNAVQRLTFELKNLDISEGDLIVLKLSRAASNGLDTSASDLRVLKITTSLA